MGLLDSLGYGNQGGYGGLLDMLMYQSPLAQKPEYSPYAGINTAFDTSAPQPTNIFGLPPQMSAPPASNATFGPVPQLGPQPPMTPAPSFDSFGQRPGTFSQMAPTLPPAVNVGSGGNVAPLQDTPTQTASIGSGPGSYQMPQFGAASDYTPQAAGSPSTDISAQSRQPQSQQGLPASFGNDEGRLTAGFRSLGNPGGIINKLADAVQGFTTGQRSDAVGIQQQNLRAQFNATRDVLKQSGMSDQEANSKAMLAVLNPEAGKTILPEALTSKTEIKMVKDALGAEHPYSWNAREQTFKPVDTQGEVSGGGAAPGQGPQLLAPGVKQYNPSLSGEEYLGQFSPEVKAAVKAYINGDVLPSGNPRQQAIANMSKTFAQKYGADMGIPVSDALFAEKRKYRTELGTNSPNSAGGQAKAFNQGISHMAPLADNLEKLDNSNGLGIPVIAQGVNATRQAFSNQQSAISDEAKSLGQTVAGEVGKLFSGSAGGGVHERELTRERFDTVKSKPQLAAALRATLETMDGGLKALEQRRDSVLGPNSGVDLVSDATRQNIAKIQGVIDRLEGKSSGGIPSGWSVKVR